jgi:deoxycytidine triphosphate deaminase
MILTDREIQVALATGQIKINPTPTEDAYSSSSLDLSLGSKLRIWKTTPGGVDSVVSPADPNFRVLAAVEEMAEARNIGPNGYILEPGSFLLAWTAESVELPIRSRLAARVEGKSSLARLGIGVHVTAPTIHAGFRGLIQLEVCNHGPLRVKLAHRMPVCQLIFEQTLGTPEKGYAGQFLGQSGEGAAQRSSGSSRSRRSRPSSRRPK